MNVCIHYYGKFYDLVTKIQETIMLNKAIDLSCLYQRVKEKYTLDIPIDKLQVAVNHTIVSWNYVVSCDDIVVFLLPFAGG